MVHYLERRVMVWLRSTTVSPSHTTKPDQVAVDMDFHKTMYALHRKVSAREVIVGWYATGGAITEHSNLIHEFYGRELAMPVHLCVDTNINEAAKMEVKAYTSMPVRLGEKELGSRFVEVGCQLLVSDAEKLALDVLLDNKNDITGEGRLAPQSDLEGLETSIGKTQELLEIVSKYVDGVMKGEVEPNHEIGRILLDTVAAVPALKPGVFEKVFHNVLQDLLMVAYLSNMTRTQLALAERIQAVV